MPGFSAQGTTLVQERDESCVPDPSAGVTCYDPLFEWVALEAAMISDDGTQIECPGVPTWMQDQMGGLVPGPFVASLAFSYDKQELLWGKPVWY